MDEMEKSKLAAHDFSRGLRISEIAVDLATLVAFHRMRMVLTISLEKSNPAKII